MFCPVSDWWVGFICLSVSVSKLGLKRSVFHSKLAMNCSLLYWVQLPISLLSGYNVCMFIRRGLDYTFRILRTEVLSVLAYVHPMRIGLLCLFHHKLFRKNILLLVFYWFFWNKVILGFIGIKWKSYIDQNPTQYLILEVSGKQIFSPLNLNKND